MSRHIEGFPDFPPDIQERLERINAAFRPIGHFTGWVGNVDNVQIHVHECIGCGALVDQAAKSTHYRWHQS